ncbi:nucleoside-binding protein [Melghiribacillus thermohalophilus]|uniref:Nucleoside-binding protein n=1 Tax=Melghiribacillus thermohalophilus TaxID=1324956 RepID=A0A4R3NAR4_9BACI|nr:BMP family protein [Melghiribacillus thermohalophilus]TCT26709.1 nucleoside-binding protein [Melghiribacillus thermohalophilus]
MKKRLLMLLAMLFSAAMVLAACGTGDDEGQDTEGTDDTDQNEAVDFTVAMVTDVGGVDDKSFNQSAWEGLSDFGKENGLEEMKDYTYAQSETDQDYKTNLNRLVRQGYDLIYGIGYLLQPAVDEVAQQNPDTNFAIVDSVAEQPNVASITFKEHQGSFLVGVAAAMKTKTNKVGFIGGTDSDLINKFEVGFRAGVKSVNPDAEVVVQYAGGFNMADKGKVIASSMYNQGVDVIYHASGATGNGAFTEAKDRKKNNPDEDIWVIGVDRDQYEEGAVTVDGQEYNVTLTSMVKRVDVAVKDLSTRALEGDFPGGEILEYGLEDNGISVATTNEEALTEDILHEISKWEEQIVNGDIEVPKNHDELEEYLNSL